MMNEEEEISAFNEAMFKRFLLSLIRIIKDEQPPPDEMIAIITEYIKD